MTKLRERYLRDLAIRGKAARTQESYVSYVADLARYHGRSPDLLSYDEVADWLHYLIRERRLAPSSVNIAVQAARFLFGITLGRDMEELRAKVPHCKRTQRRAQAYSVEEIETILQAALRPRDRALLMLVYSAGLRVSEACGLQVPEGIDRARMQVRVLGKGAKERVLPLSPKVLEALEAYWRAERKDQRGGCLPFLFIAPDRCGPLDSSTAQSIYYRAVKASGVRRKGGIHILRHSFATHLIESGVPIPMVQRLLGHSSMITTARYLHVTAQRLDRVRSALGLIESPGLSPSR
jgi:site-specific recombinase XerD